MTILVAEDQPASALILRNILEHDGHRVIVVADGKAALKALDDRPDIGLVIADIRMPEMDGIELVTAMKEREELADIPVIFVSGVADAGIVKRAATLGSKGYILKPVNEPSRVLDRVAAAIVGVKGLLDERDHAIDRPDVDLEALRKSRLEFAGLVHGAIATVEGGADGADDVEGLRDLARMLGADRLLAAMDGASAGPQGRSRLQRELRALTHVLPAPKA